MTHQVQLTEPASTTTAHRVVLDDLLASGAPGTVLVELSKDADSLVLGGHGYRKGAAIVTGSVTS